MPARATRTRTIRTRLEGEALRQRLAALAEEQEPEGARRLLADGFFLAGHVDGQAFDLAYRHNNPRNAQTFDVHGVIDATPDWQILHLRMTAQQPWARWWEIAIWAAVAAGLAVARSIKPGAALVIFAFVNAVYAFANLLYIPDVSAGRIARLVARAVNGSVLENGSWVVPPAA
ncbi:MAG TPA: hypothetical protein VGN09_05525 [Vicinamibacteria bacterium]